MMPECQSDFKAVRILKAYLNYSFTPDIKRIIYILDKKGVALSRSMLDRYRINPVTYAPVFQAMVCFLFEQGIISMD